MAVRRAILITAIIFLFSCSGGGGPGSPGSFGSDETNVSMSAVARPAVSGTPNVFASCFFAEDHAEVSITARQIFPEISPGVQYIERYEVLFYTQTTGAPPIESNDSIYQTMPIDCSDNACLDPAEPQLELDAIWVDRQRKADYIEDVISGQYDTGVDDMPIYAAQFKFFGKDQWGAEFGFQTTTTFTIGVGSCPESATCSTNCAAEGACSNNDGADCAAGPDYDGSVICTDGWRNSSALYQCQ